MVKKMRLPSGGGNLQNWPKEGAGADELSAEHEEQLIGTRSCEQRHAEMMCRLQKEWQDNISLHYKIKGKLQGIRSSQISALVMLLVRKGIL